MKCFTCTLACSQDNMITLLTALTMLQEIHPTTGSLHIASNSVLQALQSLHNKETMKSMRLDTCRDLHVCDYRHQHPEFVHVSEFCSASLRSL
eukprot:3370302-Prorocentrum_lima.AAC.1